MAYETLSSPLKLEPFKSDPCYFGLISRNLAEKYLEDRAMCEGTFLIREGKEGLRLSVITSSEGKCSVLHYKIDRLSNKTYCIDARFSFASVISLIDFYKGKHTNMPQPLTEPCPKEDIAPPENGFYDEVETSTLKSITKESIALKNHLTSGKFSDVWKGSLTSFDKEVIIKIQKEAENCRRYLLGEACIISSARHINIISLLGVNSSDLCMVVLEFYKNKDLLDYLLRTDIYEIPTMERLRYVQEIGSALQHLSQLGYVHRNVRAANVLLTEGCVCKLAGFGYATKLGGDGVYVGKDDDKPITPNIIRWMALEAIEFNRFSTASDVWALGCLIHELFTDGEAPFSGMLMPNILPRLKSGYRSPKPSRASDGVYNFMLKCWSPIPNNRPTFKEIQVLINEERKLPKIRDEFLQQPPLVPRSRSLRKTPSKQAKDLDRINTYTNMKAIYANKSSFA